MLLITILSPAQATNQQSRAPLQATSRRQQQQQQQRLQQQQQQQQPVAQTQSQSSSTATNVSNNKLYTQIATVRTFIDYSVLCSYVAS